MDINEKLIVGNIYLYVMLLILVVTVRVFYAKYVTKQLKKWFWVVLVLLVGGLCGLVYLYVTGAKIVVK